MHDKLLLYEKLTVHLNFQARGWLTFVLRDRLHGTQTRHSD